MPNKIKLVPSGYFASRRILYDLKSFRDLILHYIPFVGYEEQASRPLEEILPGDVKSTSEKHRTLKQKINELIPIVRMHFTNAGIEREISVRLPEPGGKKERREYDLISHFFELPHDPSATYYEMLLSVIDRAIGFYEQIKRAVFRDLFNPIFWVACIFRIPLLIIQKMGMVSTKEAASQIFKIYIWMIRILVGFILIFIATKLGISINWAKIINLIK